MFAGTGSARIAATGRSPSAATTAPRSFHGTTTVSAICPPPPPGPRPPGTPPSRGVAVPEKGFLDFLREQADEHVGLLVLDEVISGFRVARGGAQELYGVEADITVLGK